MSALAAPAAHASTGTISRSDLAAAGCRIYSGQTYKSGHYILGSMRFAACSGRATMSIQRSRWYGWEYMKQQTVSANPGTRTISYDCQGDGTYDYRTILEGRIAGNPVYRESNHIRVSC